MSKTTIVGCIALLGTEPHPSNGPVDIEIEGRYISSIMPTGQKQPEGRIIDGHSHLLTPGLINGHIHSHEHFHKGFFRDNLPLEPWMNYVRPLKPINFNRRQIYLRTMLGAIEALRSGTTSLNDDFNVSPFLNRDHVYAAFEAYDDVGLRANLGMTLFDRPFFRAVPYVDEEFPKELLKKYDAVRPTPPEQILALVRELAVSRHPESNRVGCIVAPSAPQRCTEQFLRTVRELATEFDLPVMMHVQETRVQVVTGLIEHGTTFIEYLSKIGFLAPKTQFIHSIWLNPREIALLAESGVSLQHNPSVNMMVGSGMMPVRAVLDAGINLALGSDGCGSIETCDMQKALFAGALMHKLRGWDHDHWVGAEEIWRAATLGGAMALGRGDELGALETGRIADLVAYKLRSPHLTPLNNPLRQIVYAETGRDVDMVFVDGEEVMMNGRLSRIDEDAILEEVAEEHQRLLPEMISSREAVSEMVLPMERIYRRCQHYSIADDTYPTRVPS